MKKVGHLCMPLLALLMLTVLGNVFEPSVINKLNLPRPICSLLINRGANLSSINVDGETALDLAMNSDAADAQKTEVLSTLLLFCAVCPMMYILPSSDDTITENGYG